MTRINLLPPEIRERQRARRQTTIVAAAGLAVILLLGGFYVLQQITLSGVEDELAEQNRRNQELESQVQDLRRFDELLAEIEQKEELLATLLTNEVRWSGVLRDISLVIPTDAWLESMNGTIQPEATLPADQAALIGSITFTGVADRHPTVAEWLTALEKIIGFENPWVSESAGGQIEGLPVVNFTSSVDLSGAVTVEGRRP